MVTTIVVEASNRAVASDKSAGRPYVAVVGGGTSGIGSYAALALAKTHGEVGKAASRGVRVYVLGRRSSDELMKQLKEACPFGTFEFVQAEDMGLMKDVDRVCGIIIDKETKYSASEGHPAKIDLVVASQGIISFSGREDTTEGLERSMAISYYGRARMVDRLLPLLTQAVSPPAVGHVAFVMNPSLEGDLVVNDLSLRKNSNFSLRNRGAHLGSFTTFYLEALAARFPSSLALVHYYPGGVKSDIANTSNLGFWTRTMFRIALPLMRIHNVPEAESGQRVAFLGTTAVYPPAADKTPRKLPTGTAVTTGADGKVGSGAYRVNWDDETHKVNAKAAGYHAQGMVDKVYEHTQAAFDTIAAGKKFTE